MRDLILPFSKSSIYSTKPPPVCIDVKSRSNTIGRAPVTIASATNILRISLAADKLCPSAAGCFTGQNSL
ncbi:hypothetical protein EGJ48_23000 [Pantoea dispersa]|nr:hypothetical protein EGJ48_23000 [Pantoea dispersa]